MTDSSTGVAIASETAKLISLTGLACSEQMCYLFGIFSHLNTQKVGKYMNKVHLSDILV